MEYKLFNRLYNEALSYNEFEMYVAERGWQDWMEGYSADEIVAILQEIYSLAYCSVGELKKGMSRVEFGRNYGIPIRTLEDWDAGKRMPPNYVVALIAYTVFTDTGRKTNE